MTDQHDTTSGAGPAMRMLAVASIVASTTNPRKTFNTAKLAELAESIKASGVHQPILCARCRPDGWPTPLPTAAGARHSLRTSWWPVNAAGAAASWPAWLKFRP